MRIVLLMYILVELTLVGCNKPPCHNTNPVLENSPVNSLKYNEELAKYVGRDNDVRYWIKGYEESDGRNYVLLDVYGSNVCAEMWLDITNAKDQRMTGMRKGKANGYYGARLKSVKFVVERDSNIHFIYTGSSGVED